MREMLTHIPLRLYAWIGIVFTMIIVPFSLFLSEQFSQYAYSQMDQFHRDKVLHTANQTDFILNKLKTYGLNMYEDSSIQNWLQSERIDPLADMAVLNTLTNFLSTEPFIQRVYLINLKAQRVFDSQNGVTAFDAFADTAMLEKVREQQSLFLQFFPHEVHGVSHLALIVPSTPVKLNSRGYLVLLLHNENLQNYLLANGIDQGTEIIVVDEEGRNVFDRTRSVDVEGGPGQFVNSASLASQNWTVYSLARMTSFQTQADAFRRNIIVNSMLLLVLLLTVGLWNSQRTLKPFRTLAKQLQQKFQPASSAAGKAIGDGYDVLKSGIERLSSQVDEMNLSLKEHRQIVKAEYMRQWLLQGKMSRSALEEIAETTPLFEREYIRIAVVKIESYHEWTERYDFASRRLFKYAIGNIAEEVVSIDGGVLEAADLAGDHVVLLIGLDASTEDMAEVLETVKAHIRRYLRLYTVVAVSDPRAIRDDVREAYEMVYELTFLKFISGIDRVYTEEDYEHYIQMIQPGADLKSVEKLLASIKSGSKEQVVSLLDDVFAQLSSMKFSECKMQLTVLLFSVMKEFGKLSAMQGVDSIERQLAGFPTLQDVRAWLERELLKMTDRINSNKRKDRKEKLTEEILAFIDYRIHDPMLSAEDVAEHVSLSAKYVRQIFLEALGEPLSSYILNLRIGKVKELLTTTDLPVTEIGERSGFLTKSHFFTAFKKATGLTPNQYRQIYAKEEGTRRV